MMKISLKYLTTLRPLKSRPIYPCQTPPRTRSLSQRRLSSVQGKFKRGLLIYRPRQRQVLHSFKSSFNEWKEICCFTNAIFLTKRMSVSTTFNPPPPLIIFELILNLNTDDISVSKPALGCDWLIYFGSWF